MTKELMQKLEDLLSGKCVLNIKIGFGLEEVSEKKPVTKKATKKEPMKKVDTDKEEPNQEVKKETPIKGSATVDEFDKTLGDNKNEVKPDPKNTGIESPVPKKDIEKVEAAKDESKEEKKKVSLQEGQEHCIACSGTGESSTGNRCVPCKGTGIKQKVDEEKPKEEKKNENSKEDKDDDWDF